MLAIYFKEIRDHFARRRFGLMLGLVLVAAVWGIFIDKNAVVAQGTGSFYLDVFTNRVKLAYQVLRIALGTYKSTLANGGVCR